MYLKIKYRGTLNKQQQHEQNKNHKNASTCDVQINLEIKSTNEFEAYKETWTTYKRQVKNIRGYFRRKTNQIITTNRTRNHVQAETEQHCVCEKSEQHSINIEKRTN